ncbi:hypothetical protein [Microbacterium sp. BH-3-3-3]|uniref:hypothetical protein n=1 Tax=Microbacterium sp. BH-3-3-3 TaxID=1906742 RepID=UPI0012EA4E7D|nr:hypothetical protein [Microbacterium sp. BH-3-3-3]
MSHETVAVDGDLSVQSYRKPLSVITDGRAHKEQIAPSDLGLRELPGAPLVLTALTLIERQSDAAAPGATVVDTIDAICKMTPQISYLPELPTALQYLARLFDAIGAPTLVIYRDAVELPALVSQMFASPGLPAPSWTVPARSDRSGPWRATTYDDAILVGGRACILRHGVVTALGPLGRLVWTQCLAGASPDEIAAAAVAEFGEPDEGGVDRLIAGALDDLNTHGLIEAR